MELNLIEFRRLLWVWTWSKKKQIFPRMFGYVLLLFYRGKLFLSWRKVVRTIKLILFTILKSTEILMIHLKPQLYPEFIQYRNRLWIYVKTLFTLEDYFKLHFKFHFEYIIIFDTITKPLWEQEDSTLQQEDSIESYLES